MSVKISSQPTRVRSGKLETGSWGRTHPMAWGVAPKCVRSPWWGLEGRTKVCAVALVGCPCRRQRAWAQA